LTSSLARQHKWSKTSKDDGERVSEGRQDTLAGLHCQATTLQLPAAQVSAALAEHAASEAWRVKALELLRSTTPVAAPTSNPHAHPGLHPDQVVLPDPQPLFLDPTPQPQPQPQPEQVALPELQRLLAAVDEQGSLEYESLKLAAARRELLQQVAPQLGLPTTIPPILGETKGQ